MSHKKKGMYTFFFSNLLGLLYMFSDATVL